MINRVFIVVLCLLIGASTSFSGQYRIPTDVVDIRVIEIEGHKYVVSAVMGWGEAKVPSISMLHFEGCRCKNAMNVNEKTEFVFPNNLKVWKYYEQNGICPNCTNHFDFVEMSGDHIVPRSNGGKTEYSNLQMICIPCFNKKRETSGRNPK